VVIKRERWVDYLKKRAAEIAETYNKEMANTTYKTATEGNLGAAIQRLGGEEEEEVQQFTTSNRLSPSPPTSWCRVGLCVRLMCIKNNKK
jgi:hypothetical protein